MTEFYDYIEDYKAGRLSDEDQVSFINAMKADPSLQRAVDNHDVMKKVEEYLEEEEIREVIDRVRKKNEDGAKVIGMRRWMGVAAGVAALVICGFFLRQQNLSSELNKLVATLQIPVIEFGEKGSNQSNNELSACDRAQLSFNKNDFNKTILNINNNLSQVDVVCKQKAQILLSISYVKTKEQIKADSVLNEILNTEQKHFYIREAQKLKEILKI